MSNLSKDLILDGYWVNKKSGTIHFVSEDEAIGGRARHTICADIFGGLDVDGYCRWKRL